MASGPRIGVPRVYPGPLLPVLYPGEQATATLAFRDIDMDGAVAVVQAVDWIVEPTSGFHGWWLRMRYRMFGRWLEPIDHGGSR